MNIKIEAFLIHVVEVKPMSQIFTSIPPSNNSFPLSDEPFYQNQEMSKENVKHSILNEWFCQQLFLPSNTYEANCQLTIRIQSLMNYGFTIAKKNQGKSESEKIMYSLSKYSNKRKPVTFESLRRNDGWSETFEQIVSEEVENYGSFGSIRGFHTFHFTKICNLVVAKTVWELWVIPTLYRRINAYARVWIEKRFAPGGEGYAITEAHFNNLASTCSGCIQNQPNQLAHTCLEWDVFDE